MDEILQPGAHRCWAAPSPNPHMDPTAPKNPSPAPQVEEQLTDALSLTRAQDEASELPAARQGPGPP